MDVTPALLPGVFSLLEASDFAAVAQTHRRLSSPAQQWRERELLRLEKEIDAFMAAVRSGDRLVVVVEYAAPYLRYFDFDERRGGRSEEKEGGGGGGPVGNPVVVANSGTLHRKSFMEKVKSTMRRQADYVRHGIVTGPALPARIVLLRSKQNSVMEQDLLTKVLPLYTVFPTTGYYSGDFVLDERKIERLVTTKAFDIGSHHLAYLQVPGFLAEFSANLWHNKHRYARQLAGADLFFTPLTAAATELQRYFLGTHVLVLPSPLGPEALTRWSDTHPVYG